MNIGFLPLPVDPISKAMTHPLRSTGITPLQHYYEAVRPQGGIINRPRSPDIRVARRDDFGFGWGWLGFSNTPGRGGQSYDPRQNNRNYYQRSQRWF